jgi:hypothetical protein
MLRFQTKIIFYITKKKIASFASGFVAMTIILMRSKEEHTQRLAMAEDAPFLDTPTVFSDNISTEIWHRPGQRKVGWWRLTGRCGQD